MKSLPLVLFLIVNFAGLYWGGRSTGPGVTSEWYAELPKAPWTPPGWVFGAAWTVVMVGFSWFMAGVWRGTQPASGVARTPWMIAFAVVWLLNVLWNPVFFSWHLTGWALLILIALLAGISVLAVSSHAIPHDGAWRWGILPYVVWLLVAISLNAWFVAKGV